jgi:hypothetical protein
MRTQDHGYSTDFHNFHQLPSTAFQKFIDKFDFAEAEAFEKASG